MYIKTWYSLYFCQGFQCLNICYSENVILWLGSEIEKIFEFL